ncbi:hypothetical protein ZHAS_00019227 [Anopheles sinensis]|uniref:Uncharacterized protein n=1 Tax=Anopheles sinensis TaxID=74873 RepID=A0A084WKT4_ANOSI|nr:hypothetical protein ZHAS_00019227 [Anopheles sinensis]
MDGGDALDGGSRVENAPPSEPSVTDNRRTARATQSSTVEKQWMGQRNLAQGKMMPVGCGTVRT